MSFRSWKRQWEETARLSFFSLLLRPEKIEGKRHWLLERTKRVENGLDFFQALLVLFIYWIKKWYKFWTWFCRNWTSWPEVSSCYDSGSTPETGNRELSIKWATLKFVYKFFLYHFFAYCYNMASALQSAYYKLKQIKLTLL